MQNQSQFNLNLHYKHMEGKFVLWWSPSHVAELEALEP